MLIPTAAILHDPSDEPPIQDEKRAVFYAAAEFNVCDVYPCDCY